MVIDRRCPAISRRIGPSSTPYVDDPGDRDVDAIAAINAGGYVDSPLHNDSDDSDAHNAINASAMVGADVSIRPRRDHNEFDDINDDRGDGIAHSHVIDIGAGDAGDANTVVGVDRR